VPAAGRLSAGGTSGQLWEELRRRRHAPAGGRRRRRRERARGVPPGSGDGPCRAGGPTREPVAQHVARAADNQPEMGNSRPGCRLEDVFSQARIAPICSARQTRGRTFKPAAQMRNSLGAPFVLQALSQKPMNRARPLPALSPHPGNKRKAVNNRRICRPLRPLARLRTALSDGSHEAQLSLCTAGVRGSISLWPATTGSKSARQGVGLPLGSSRAV